MLVVRTDPPSSPDLGLITQFTELPSVSWLVRSSGQLSLSPSLSPLSRRIIKIPENCQLFIFSNFSPKMSVRSGGLRPGSQLERRGDNGTDQHQHPAGYLLAAHSSEYFIRPTGSRVTPDNKDLLLCKCQQTVGLCNVRATVYILTSQS